MNLWKSYYKNLKKYLKFNLLKIAKLAKKLLYTETATVSKKIDLIKNYLKHKLHYCIY